MQVDTAFNKLLFRISCTPELFQKCMGKILVGLEGAVSLIVNVLVFGHTIMKNITPDLWLY